MMELKRLPLRGVHNFRDMGGYPAGFCKATKWRQFFRADGMFELEKEDIDFIINYCKIKTVIDLRGAKELKERPNSFARIEGVRLHNIPLVAKDDYFAEWVTLERGYISVARDGKSQIKRVFDVIAESMPGSVLFHCTAGKDRTGIISCLVLGACGVDNFDIVGDYEVSSTYIRRDLVRILEPGEELNMEYVYSRAETMYKLLEFIEAEHGSITSFLLDCGVTEGKLETIKRNFLVDITVD